MSYFFPTFYVFKIFCHILTFLTFFIFIWTFLHLWICGRRRGTVRYDVRDSDSDALDPDPEL